jgi:hypothetical protein
MINQQEEEPQQKYFQPQEDNYNIEKQTRYS